MAPLKLISVTLALALSGSAGWAVPIVQTNTTDLTPSGTNDYRGHFLSTSWNFNRYDPSLGPLTQVTIEMSWNVLGTVWEVNPFPQTQTFTPSLLMEFSGNVIDVAGHPLLLLPPTYATQSASAVPWAPGESVSYSGSLSGTSIMTLSAPADLARFIGNDTGQFFVSGRFTGFNDWGDANATGTTTMRVTYNAPDSGATVWLLGGAISGLALIRRRRPRACAI